MQMRNVVSVLALNPQPSVEVKGTNPELPRPAGVPVLPTGPLQLGEKLESKPGEAVLVAARAPDVVVKAVPESGPVAGLKVMLVALYAHLGSAVLDAILDRLVTPGVLGSLLESIPWFKGVGGDAAQEMLALALMGAIVAWKNRRQRSKAGK